MSVPSRPVTEQEASSLSRLVSLRRFAVYYCPVGLVMAGVTFQLREAHIAIAAALAALLAISLVGWIIYVSFFLRCPRCSGWVALTSKRCLSCWLLLEQEARK